MKKIIPLFAFIIIIAGCTREYNCTDDTLRLSFIGFAKADIDTIVIRKFAAATNFQQLTDTMQFTIDTTGISQSNDTISFGGAAVNNVIQYGSDWQVFIPSKNKTITISNIVSPREQGKCSTGYYGKVACVCYNSIRSVMENGQTVAYPPRDTSFNGYKLYIDN